MSTEPLPQAGVPDPRQLHDRLVAAFARRQPLLQPSVLDSFRLVHGAGDGLEGLAIDRYADGAVVHVRGAAWLHDDVAMGVGEVLQSSGLRWLRAVADLGRKERGERDASAERRFEEVARGGRLLGPPERVIALESGRRFSIRPREPFSPGLFVDMRGPRADLAARWRGRRVLNLFAYTCGFGVALADRNAVTNVDLSRRALLWGRESYALNGLDTPDDCFVQADVFEHVRGLIERGERFDAVILDPPVHSQGKGGRARNFSLRRDLGWLVERGLDLLDRDGELFVSTNYAELGAEAFRTLIVGVARDWDYWLERQWPAPVDFVSLPGTLHLKTALLRPRVAGAAPGRKRQTPSRREAAQQGQR
jgi:23S rRNA (cytosine1962-C5)-methyltransferase